MSFAWMRRIDAWIGKPLIRLLGIFTRRARSLYGDRTPEQLPKRVIVTKFIGLGSVVLSLPLLKALKEQGAEIAFWSFEGQADLARFSGYVDEVLTVRASLTRFLPTLLSSWWAARRFKPDAFLDLEPTANFTAILARMSGARIRVGFISAKPVREALFTHLVALTPERHMIENNLWMARRLGFETEAEAALPATPDISRIRNFLPAMAARRRITININSSDLSWHRMWPEDRWVALCDQLLDDRSVDLVFPGTASERDRVQSVVARLKDPSRAFNLAGETRLVELLRILKDSELVVSVDSGIMHLASWTGTPLVALFGPETPRLYAPRTRSASVIWAGLPCSPCLSVAADKITRCRDNQCMKMISPEQVLMACRWMRDKVSVPAKDPAAAAIAARSPAA